MFFNPLQEGIPFALGLLREHLSWMKVILLHAPPPPRVHGKRGRGAAGKTPVFGFLKRDGKLYVEIVGKDHVIAYFLSCKENFWKAVLFILMDASESEIKTNKANIIF